MKYYIIFFLILLFPLQISIFAQDAKTKTTVVDSLYPDLEITIVDNRLLVVKNAPIGKTLTLHYPVGIKAKQIQLKSSYGEYPLNLPKTLYYIAINGRIVKKIVIR